MQVNILQLNVYVVNPYMVYIFSLFLYLLSRGNHKRAESDNFNFTISKKLTMYGGDFN